MLTQEEMTQYTVADETDLEILLRKLEKGPKTKNKENIALSFSYLPNLLVDGIPTTVRDLFALIQEKKNVVSLKITLTHFELLKSALGLTSFPNLRSVSLSISCSTSNCAALLTTLQAYSLLENITIQIPTPLTTTAERLYTNATCIEEVLNAMRNCVNSNTNLKSILIEESSFHNTIKNNDRLRKLYEEIQSLLKQHNGNTLEKLGILAEELIGLREEFTIMEKLAIEHAKHRFIQTANTLNTEALKQHENAFFTLADSLIKRGEVDAHYYVARVQYTIDPINAYSDLKKIPDTSNYYAKAHALMADILMMNGVHHAIFHPTLTSEAENASKAEDVMEEFKESDAERRERIQKIISHLLIATPCAESRPLLNSLLKEYTFGSENSVSPTETPFDKMPVNIPNGPFFHVLDMLNKAHQSQQAITLELKQQKQALENTKKQLASTQNHIQQIEEQKISKQEEQQPVMLFSQSQQSVTSMKKIRRTQSWDSFVQEEKTIDTLNKRVSVK